MFNSIASTCLTYLLILVIKSTGLLVYGITGSILNL